MIIAMECCAHSVVTCKAKDDDGTVLLRTTMTLVTCLIKTNGGDGTVLLLMLHITCNVGNQRHVFSFSLREMLRKIYGKVKDNFLVISR